MAGGSAHEQPLPRGHLGRDGGGVEARRRRLLSAGQTVDALVAAAHAHDLKVVAHASRSDAVAMAQRAGVDVLTHASLDRPINEAQAAELMGAGTVIVPTLTMMQGIVENLKAAGRPGPAYEPARATVATRCAAGMPILAGTDANATPAAPASPVFGERLHDELGLLVDAGLTPVEALDAATSVAAASRPG